jgi:hypothetical protein
MAVKDENYLGAAGEDAVSAELLQRGYNLAKFRLDEGVDLLVSNSLQDTLSAVQVKTAEPVHSGKNLVCHYLLDKEQLKKSNRLPFFYVFVSRPFDSFQFVVVPRKELFMLRIQFEQTAKREANASELNLRLFFAQNGEISCWGQSFSKYLGFETYFPALSHSAK